MTEEYKQCAQCNEAVPQHANFCPHCRHTEFQELTPELAEKLAALESVTDSAALRLEAGRLIIASVLSGGLYFLYWLYLTWRQLAHETHDQHFPVWHALTWIVPIYQLFRLHRHTAVIQDLALKAGVPTTLTAGTVVALGIVSIGLGMVSLLTITPALLMFLGLIGIAITTTIIVWSQGALNAYWTTKHGEKLRAAPIETAERLVVLLGIVFWIITLTI